jgi:micrococcal nuclease
VVPVAASRLLALALALLAASCAGPATAPSISSEASTSPTSTGSTAAAGPDTSAISTTSGTGTAATSTQSTPGEPADLLEVLDGDTLRVVVGGEQTDVRLLGINAPERDECFSTEAREAAAALLASGPLSLQSAPEPDQYGRLLAYAYAGSTPLNAALLEGGYALAVQTDHPRLAEFLADDQRAYEARLGMWAADACGPATGAALALTDIVSDPPGADEDDPNGEWVLVSNQGAQSVDLSGWTLRDESSSHRYRFPDATVLTPGSEVRVHTGCGTDTLTDLHWCAQGPVWNNAGDTALLLDPNGNVVSRLRYP